MTKITKLLALNFVVIHVNDSNILPNLKQDHENRNVRLIEEEFMKRMWGVQE